jgi:hypothetical protein
VEKICIAWWRRPQDPVPVAADTLASSLSSLSYVVAATVHVEADGFASLRHGTAAGGELLTGLASVWVDSYQDLDVASLLGAAPVAGWHSWLVCESVPQSYGDAFTWPEGTPSPGLSIVTLLDKPAQLPEAEFYRCWHELHRATTAECHPFTSYVRNEVARPLTVGAPAIRGIVTEAAPSEQDFLDPDRFYVSGGDAERLRANQERVFEEVVRFIDLTTIQVAPMTEVVVRRLAPSSP